MSDKLPLEIQAEIMKRLPVKSLIQFRSVSKAWKSLIDSSRFIKRYTSQQQHLLVRYDHGHVCKPTYVSVVDDDETFPHQKVSLTLPLLVSMLQFHRIICSSQGLLCLYGHDALENYMAFLWNPYIRRAVAVPLPNLGDWRQYGTALGFWVCGKTTDPKIVKIKHICWGDETNSSVPDTIPWQVEVFTLSTGVWRSPYTTNLPRKSITFSHSQVVIDGLCYWLATDTSTIDAGFKAYNLIISFHMISEEFREVNLPNSLVYDGSIDCLDISNLRESLVVLAYNEHEGVSDVWLMKDGVSKSFTKLYTICSPGAALLSVPRFRKTGELVIQIVDNDADRRNVTCAPSLLAVYEPKSKHISNLGINGQGSFDVYSYRETLLLLDQPDFTVYE